MKHTSPDDSRFRSFMSDSTVRYALMGVFIILAVEGGTYSFVRESLPPQVPLFYSLPWGAERLAPPEFLLILPASTLAITVVNGILALWWYFAEKLVSRLLVLASFIVGLLGLYTFIRIVLLMS